MRKAKISQETETEAPQTKRRRTEQVDVELASTSQSYLSRSSLQQSENFNSELWQPLGFSGRVEKLQMTNFMCHSNLELKFNSRINFIIGRNGSGKSAVMAALVVVLGGTANLTERGSGVADFIKKGETAAKVSITLLNDGLFSYKREVYGSQIIIVRSFTVSSSNSYTCKSEAGKIISKKKGEVDKIREALNLQIKNPICILNQDVARSFLSATDNHTRFLMFMKATRLDELQTLYAETYENLVQADRELSEKNKRLEDARKEVASLKEKLAYFVELEKTAQEKRHLENEFLWSLVVIEENGLSKLKEEKDGLVEKKAEIEKRLGNKEGETKELDRIIEDIERQVAELSDRKNEKVGAKRELGRELENVQRQLETAEHQLRQLKAKGERQMADTETIRVHIAQTDDSEKDSDKEKAVETLRSLEEELSLLKERMRISQRDADNAQATQAEHRQRAEEAASEVADFERRKRHVGVQVEGMRSKGDVNALKFGNHVPRLLDAIEEAHRRNRFIRRPVGPCGMHVSLTVDRKWGGAVESVIGSLMRTFCCDNKKDMQVLTGIMDSVIGPQGQPSIVMSQFQPRRHQVSGKRVSMSGLTTVLDALEITDDVVFNTLIDQARIETIVLLRSDEQASALLSNAATVPKNLRMGVTLQGDQYYPAPNYRTYAGRNAPMKFLDKGERKEEIIQKLESEIAKLDEQIATGRAEVAAARVKVTEVAEFVKKSESSLGQLKKRQRGLEREMAELKDVVISRPVLQTRVALEEELELLLRNSEQTKQTINERQELLTTLAQKKLQYASQVKEVGKEERKMAEEVETLDEELDKTRRQRNTEKSNREAVKNKLSDMSKRLEGLEGDIGRAEGRVKAKDREASEVCPERVPTERTPTQIQKLLEKCERYLKNAEKITGSKDQIIEEFKQKRERYKDLRKSVDKIKDLIDTFSYAAVSKEEKFKEKQSHTVKNVNQYFQALLRTRNYEGILHFDFEERTLELEVSPREEGKARKDCKTLSGGERSYAMVSFILAMWEEIPLPFYFLDEFDVFMDPVNRKIIMDLMVESATQKKQRQFVFITPQDVSNVKPSDVVSLYRMPDPERKLV